jgi:isocitrate dehydrogenase (NAD+)
MQAAMITLPDPNDIGSPNALLREYIDGTVILRTGRHLPRVNPPGVSMTQSPACRAEN